MGSLETILVVKTVFLVQPLIEVQRNKGVSQNIVMTRRPQEIHLPGHEAFRVRLPETLNHTGYIRAGSWGIVASWEKPPSWAVKAKSSG